MNVEPLISVIIPTRERSETLFFTIQTALDQTSNSYEIIVSDNFSQDNTKEIVCGFNDSRLRYINTGKRVSMSDNFEFALEHAKGKYIIFIGDDDAIMPRAIDELQSFILKNPCKVYRWSLHGYVWPIDENNAIAYHFASPTAPYEISLYKIARFVITHGGRGVQGIPNGYHSAIAKDIFDKIRNKTGRVFHTTQPDIFISMAVPVFVNKAIDVGFIVTVNGKSAKSNGGSSIAKEGVRCFERFVKEFHDYKIHHTLFPNIPIKTNLLPDTILVAMDLFPEFYAKFKFNYFAMWVYILQMGKIFKVNTNVWYIVMNYKKIQHFHKFNLLKFFWYFFLQQALIIHEKALDKIKLFIRHRNLDKKVPDNIRDFVKTYLPKSDNINEGLMWRLMMRVKVIIRRIEYYLNDRNM